MAQGKKNEEWHLRRPLRECTLEVRQRSNSRPGVLIWSTQDSSHENNNEWIGINKLNAFKISVSVTSSITYLFTTACVNIPRKLNSSATFTVFTSNKITVHTNEKTWCKSQPKAREAVTYELTSKQNKFQKRRGWEVEGHPWDDGNPYCKWHKVLL